MTGSRLEIVATRGLEILGESYRYLFFLELASERFLYGMKRLALAIGPSHVFKARKSKRIYFTPTA